MAIRSSEKTVTFRRPFVLSGFDRLFEAGIYRVETDEELLEGISFPAYRRVLTLFHLDVVPDQPGATQTLTVDGNDLDVALARDLMLTRIPTELRFGGSAIDLPQPLGQLLEVMPPLRSEPKLSDVISDPITRLLMLSDRLSAATVWRAFEKAQADLMARSVRETMIQSAARPGCEATAGPWK